MAIRKSIIITAIISLVIGAGVAYVEIPSVEPTYNANDNTVTQTATDTSTQTATQMATQTITQTVTQTVTQNQTGVIHESLKSWQDESYISDTQSNWKLMNQTQVNFTISANHYILVQFSAPYLLYLDNSFTGASRWEVSLVISGVGNSTVRIDFSDTNPATGNWRQLTYSPILSLMTGKLPAGTYNCSVWWRSIFNPAGANQLIVSSHNNVNAYHYDRWMDLKEIA